MEAGLVPTLGVDEKHCTIVATVWKFSNASLHVDPSKIHHSEIDTSSSENSNCSSTVNHVKRSGVTETDSESVTYDISNADFDLYFDITVYPKGRESSDEGTVSIEFNSDYEFALFYEFILCVELTCVIAVIDAEGDPRFTQSFAFSRDAATLKIDQRFVIENFVSRSVLLEEPRELLPNDTLTLHMEVILREQVVKNNVSYYMIKDLCMTYSDEGDEAYLSLDSYLVRILSEESRYFERLLETPMLEKSSGLMKIPEEEYDSFGMIGGILLHAEILPVDFVYQIFDLYTTADKYGIPTVVDTCRCWLKLCISCENALEISEFADLFDDECLNEIVIDFQATHRQDEGNPSTSKSDSKSGAVGRSGEWTCKPVYFPFGWNFVHKYFSKGESEGRKNEENEQSNEKDYFNFYS